MENKNDQKQSTLDKQTAAEELKLINKAAPK